MLAVLPAPGADLPTAAELASERLTMAKRFFDTYETRIQAPEYGVRCPAGCTMEVQAAAAAAHVPAASPSQRRSDLASTPLEIVLLSYYSAIEHSIASV